MQEQRRCDDDLDKLNPLDIKEGSLGNRNRASDVLSLVERVERGDRQRRLFGRFVRGCVFYGMDSLIDPSETTHQYIRRVHGIEKTLFYNARSFADRCVQYGYDNLALLNQNVLWYDQAWVWAALDSYGKQNGISSLQVLPAVFADPQYNRAPY